MTISKKTMKEVLESDKQIIEGLTIQLAEANNTIKELLEKQNTMEQYMDSLGINDNFDGLLNFLKILYENKDEFMEFLNMKKDNITKSVSSNIYENPEYIRLKQINNDNNKRILELESKLDSLTSNIEDNILFKQIKEQNKLFSENNQKLIQDIKIKDNTFKEYKKQMDEKIKNINSKINNKSGIPSPSVSYENKKDNDEKKN